MLNHLHHLRVEAGILSHGEDGRPIIRHSAEVIHESTNGILIELDVHEAVVCNFSMLSRHQKPHFHFGCWICRSFHWKLGHAWHNICCVRLLWYFHMEDADSASSSVVKVGSVDLSCVFSCEAVPVTELRMVEEVREITLWYSTIRPRLLVQFQKRGVHGSDKDNVSSTLN